MFLKAGRTCFHVIRFEHLLCFFIVPTRRGEAKKIVWRGEKVIFADEKGVSHSLRVWSKNKYSYMLLL